jgi:phosphoglucosamine mutase
VIVVDETGRVVDGDQLMALIAHGWKRHGAAAWRRVSSPDGDVEPRPGALPDEPGADAGAHQGRRPHVLEAMRAKGFNVGGEQSGTSSFPISATTATAW